MSATFRELAIDQLVRHPKNVRRDVGNVVDLANSISAQGILQPLVVAPDLTQQPEEPGFRYIIIAGHRRHAAAKLANVDTLPCVIRNDINTLPKQLEAMVVENTQRTDLTVIEEAQAYQALLDFPDYNVKKVAKKTGRSEATVRKRLLLNKLGDDAKGRLEDHTLNIDQALVLVDFSDDEDATEKLLGAAANSRDWGFTVQAEKRKREAPAKVEAFEKALADAGATYLPEKDRYTGRWNRIYENDSNAISIEDHVLAGHQVVIDRHWGKIEWYEKPVTAKKVKPELTDEEKEVKRREAGLSAALQIAHAVRAEHLKAIVNDPPAGAAHDALRALAGQINFNHRGLLSELLGCKQDTQEIEAALDEVSTNTLAMLVHLCGSSHEDELLKLWAWDANDYRHRYGAKQWLETLQGIYGYQLSSVEQEVLDHFAALTPATPDPEEDDEEDYDDE